jgi:hypothetical protein
MIVDAIVLLVAGSLILVGLWLLFHAAAEAWGEWRR